MDIPRKRIIDHLKSRTIVDVYGLGHDVEFDDMNDVELPLDGVDLILDDGTVVSIWGIGNTGLDTDRS